MPYLGITCQGDLCKMHSNRQELTMTQMRDFWQDRRVFVTGSTGLVGVWTVRELLARGAHVVGLVRDRVGGSELFRTGLAARIDMVRGCVEDERLIERTLAEYEIQTVFHLAAQTIVGIANRSPLSTFESNIKGTWCVLEAARRCGFEPQVIVASSDKAYGDQDTLPYTEDAPLQGRHPYDVSKSCADLIALSYAHTYRLPVCVTRCGNFFGGGDLNFNRIVPGTIRSVMRGERPLIRSDGSHLRDYFYVRDGVAAYLHLAECLAKDDTLRGEAFNFSTETPRSVLDVVQTILTVMGSSLKPDIRNTTHHEIRQQFLSANKARQRLGWRPTVEFGQAIAETVQWYRHYFSHSEDTQPAIAAA